MNSNNSVEKARERGYIVLTHPTRGIGVLDRLGRSIVATIPPDQLDELTDEKILAFLDKNVCASNEKIIDVDKSGDQTVGNQQSRNSPHHFLNVHIHHNFIWSNDNCKNLAYLIGSFEHANINLTIHVTQLFDWKKLFFFLGSVGKNNSSHRLTTTVEGELMQQDGVLDDIFKHRIVVRWPLWATRATDCPTVPTLVKEKISCLAEYGILVPLTLYVDRSGIDLVDHLIDQLSPFTMYSGFSVLPLFQHVDYSSALKPVDFSTEKYISLLLALYQKHARCDTDAVWEPLWELATTAFEGGWSSSMMIPRRMQLLISNDGAVSVFRHLPCLARPWNVLSEAGKNAQGVLCNDLISFIRQHYVEGIIAKSSCQFRYLCCGSDCLCECEAGNGKVSIETQHVCQYRSFFLEVFSWQRLSVVT